MKMKPLLVTIAGVELATGVGLLLAPSIIAELLLGQPLQSGVPLVVSRVAGIALIAIGLMCGLEKSSERDHPPRGLLAGLLVYNIGVPVLLIHSDLAYDLAGIGLWPTVVLHLALAVWLAACFRGAHSAR